MSKASYVVLVTDKVSGDALNPLFEDERFRVVQVDDSSEPAFREALAAADGLIVRSATQVEEEILSVAPKLTVVGRAGVGVDNIDLAAAAERGIAVLNAPAGNTVSTAELTMALSAGRWGSLCAVGSTGFLRGRGPGGDLIRERVAVRFGLRAPG